MKKILFAVAALALLFATSCKKENINPAIDVPEGSFLATIDNGANPQKAPRVNDGMGTMTTINSDNYVIWDDNDTIRINGESYTTQTGGNTAVVFAPADEENQATGTTFHAFYPASIAGTDAAGVLPATQTIVAGKVSNLPMYAYSTDNQLTFHNICAALKITIPVFLDGAAHIEISCSDKAMNGAFGITNNAAVMSNETPSDAEKKITIQKSSGNFATNEVVYIAVPAQKCSDFKIEFFNNSGSMWSKTIKSQKFEVNKVYNIKATPVPLCFTAQTAGATVTFNLRSGFSQTIEYSTDAMSWNTYASGTAITLTNVGDFVCFRASQSHKTAFGNTDASQCSKFAVTGDVKASGNIMSLYGPDCPNAIPVASAFEYLFTNCSGLKTAPELPATTVTLRCYFGLFNGCTSLTAAPTLPATTLASADKCYCKMFFGCAGLTAAPALPAETLAIGCYYGMFNGCSSLTAAPTLPATTLADQCYYGMFQGCTSLAAAPALPASTLEKGCYYEMFKSCSNLTEVTMKATAVSAENCLTYWLQYAGTKVSTKTLYLNPSVYTDGQAGSGTYYNTYTTIINNASGWTPASAPAQ